MTDETRLSIVTVQQAPMDVAPRNPAALFAEFTALTAGTDADCSGITYDRLERERAVRWPAPDEDSSGGYRYYNPTDDGSAAAGSAGNGPAWRFPTPSGHARFSTGRHDGVPESPSDDYPLTLTTAREPDGYNTGVRTRTAPDDPGDLIARVHPTTLAATDLETDGEMWATIESRRASVSVRVEPDETIPEEMVWLPIHHPMTNHLTIPATDPDSDEPNYKQCAVRLVAPERENESASGGTDPEQSSVPADYPAEVRQ